MDVYIIYGLVFWIGVLYLLYRAEGDYCEEEMKEEG